MVKISDISFSTLILLLAIMILLSCVLVKTQYSAPAFKKKLTTLVHKKTHSQDPIIIRIADLTDFEWDYFFIVHSYSDYNRVEAATKIDIDVLKVTEIDTREALNILVFVRSKKIIKFVEYPQISGDFGNVCHDYKLYTPKDAVFKVEYIDSYGSGRKQLEIIDLDSG